MKSSAEALARCASIALLLAVSAGCNPSPPVAQQLPAARVEATTERVIPAVPNPLIMFDGRPVTSPEMWVQQRRPELLQFFRSHVYGNSLPPQEDAVYAIESVDDAALGGKAIHKEIAMRVSRNGKTAVWHMTEYLPKKSAGASPVILALNFGGNQSICNDPGIPLRTIWSRKSKTEPMHPDAATQQCRGKDAAAWQLDRLIDHGYGLATIYYFDIEPDVPQGPSLGIRSLYWNAGTTQPAADEWGAVAAWAWGLSRGLDALQTDPAVDAHRIVVFGHSRLGKAAVWAGASDPRFAAVISNESGCGGVAILRDKEGETVAKIVHSFPHWFCANFNQYAGHESAMPTDQHEMVALIAPRPIYIGSADLDFTSDPFSEFACCVLADPVWQLLGSDGFGVKTMPALNTSVGHTIRYHDRTGKHNVTAYDWEQYLRFLDEELRR